MVDQVQRAGTRRLIAEEQAKDAEPTLPGVAGMYYPQPVTAERSPPWHLRTLLGQGLGLQWGDEAEAWARSKLSGKSYEEEHQKILADVAAFRGKYPVSAAGQEFSGAMIPFAVSTLIPPLEPVVVPRGVSALETLRRALSFTPDASIVKKGAAVGGVEGAVSGAGGAEEGYRIPGAIQGGLQGTMWGVGLPVGAGVTLGTGRAVKEAITGVPSRKMQRMAEQKLAEEMRHAGLTGEDLIRLADEDYNRLGIASTIGHYLPDTTAAITGRGGSAVAQSIERSLGEFMHGVDNVKPSATERTQDRLKNALGYRDWWTESKTVADRMRQGARANYDAAYNVGTVHDERLMEQLRTSPDFKKAFAEAKKIADMEARAARLAGEDPSPYQLQQIYTDVEVSPGVFEKQLTSIPDVRTLDYMKRGLDSIILEGMQRGKGMTTARARALKHERNNFIKIVDELVPEYKQARAVYAGEIEVQDAMELGLSKFNSTKAEQIETFMANASDAERDAYRIGAVRFLQETIFDKPNAAGAILRGDKTQNKIRALFDRQDEFDLFNAALKKEALLYGHASKAMAASGSKTTPLAQNIKNLETPVGAATDVFRSGGLTNWVLQLVSADSKLPPEVLERMATMLEKGNPTEVASVVAALEKAAARTELANRATRGITYGTVAGGTVATPGLSAEVSPGALMLQEVMDWWDKEESSKSQ